MTRWRGFPPVRRAVSRAAARGAPPRARCERAPSWPCGLRGLRGLRLRLRGARPLPHDRELHLLELQNRGGVARARDEAQLLDLGLMLERQRLPRVETRLGRRVAGA